MSYYRFSPFRNWNNLRRPSKHPTMQTQEELQSLILEMHSKKRTKKELSKHWYHTIRLMDSFRRPTIITIDVILIMRVPFLKHDISNNLTLINFSNMSTNSTTITGRTRLITNNLVY